MLRSSSCASSFSRTLLGGLLRLNRQKSTLGPVLVALLSVLGVAGCSRQGQNSRNLEAARRDYQTLCSICHGEDGKPRIPGTADLTSTAVQQQSDAVLLEKITDGNSERGMPSWKGLEEPRRRALVLYIRSLASKH